MFCEVSILYSHTVEGLIRNHTVLINAAQNTCRYCNWLAQALNHRLTGFIPVATWGVPLDVAKKMEVTLSKESKAAVHNFLISKRRPNERTDSQQ